MTKYMRPEYGWCTSYLYDIEKENDMNASNKVGKVNPFDKRKTENSVKAKSKTVKSVKPVAKDTNKTRRKMVKPTRKATI